MSNLKLMRMNIHNRLLMEHSVERDQMIGTVPSQWDMCINNEQCTQDWHVLASTECGFSLRYGTFSMSCQVVVQYQTKGTTRSLMVRVAERPRDTVSTFQRRRVEPQAAAAAATALPEAGRQD